MLFRTFASVVSVTGSRPGGLFPALALLAAVGWLWTPSPCCAETGDDRATTGSEARLSGVLGRQVQLLVDQYSALGAVTILEPRLLERQGLSRLVLDPGLSDPESALCTTVVLLSMPNVSFVLTFGDDQLPLSMRAWPVQSSTGVIELTRCGEEKRLLDTLQLQMRSRRGVIETVALVSEVAPPSVVRVLPGRDPGPSQPAPSIGQRPYLGPLPARVAAKIEALGAATSGPVEERTFLSDASGRGQWTLNVPDGCHRFAVLAPQDRDGPPDIDARLIDVIGGHALISDEEQAGEATLLYCAGRPERVRLQFTGAHPRSPVTVLHARALLPAGLPVSWGSRARATMAQALIELHAPRPEASPDFSTLGVRGETAWTMETKPGSCYLVAAAPLRGQSHHLAVYVSDSTRGPRRAQNEASDHGAAMTFCAGRSGTTRLGVHSVGTAVTWLWAIWRLDTASREPSL